MNSQACARESKGQGFWQILDETPAVVVAKPKNY
jgi:hypothetical protein